MLYLLTHLTATPAARLTRRCACTAASLLAVFHLGGCAVVTVADAAVSVAATAVSVTATVVETTVDVAAAGVKAATKDDTEPAK